MPDTDYSQPHVDDGIPVTYDDSKYHEYVQFIEPAAVTVAQLLDSLDNNYRDWDNLTRDVDADTFASFTRIADALEDHRTRRANLTPDERAEFDARATTG